MLSHDEGRHRDAGILLAHSKGQPTEDLYRRYQALFLAAVKKEATREKQVAVLFHASAYFGRVPARGEKREIREQIEDFRDGNLPLIAPITCINRLARRHRIAYLRDQAYLNPEAMEKMLLYHA